MDEVAKWEEKKRLQTTMDKYKHQLKEKNQLIEELESQCSRLKVIIARMERERISLQRRLKTASCHGRSLVTTLHSLQEESMKDTSHLSFLGILS